MRRALGLLFLCAGCGSGSSDADPAEADLFVTDAAAEADASMSADLAPPDALAVTDLAVPDAAPPDAGPPRVRFFVQPRPQDPDSPEEEVPLARYGDPVRVVVEGLPSGARATVVTTVNAGVSRAEFDSPDGTVDLARDAPLSDSSWSGVDPDGFLWSIVAPDVPPAGLDLTIRVRVEVGGEAVAEGELGRRYVDDGVVARDVAEGTRVGLLALPEGEGPFPGVLVFGGSEGGSGSGVFQAFMLAQLGYAAFGVAYFGEGPSLPASLTRVPLEILEDDLAFLAADPHVDASRLAVVGGSRGGELALLLGQYLPDVRAVVAAVPSGYVWPGGNDFALDYAWTWGGAPLPYVPAADVDAEVRLDARGEAHVTARGVFEASIAEAGAEALEAATIHAEDVQGPVLLYGGDDDRLWPSCTLAQVAWDRLVASGHTARFPDEMHCFPEAGHAILSPGCSTVGSDESYDPGSRSWLVLGGTAAGNGRAARAANTRMRAVLEAAFR